jgi:hypothetical protein
MVADYNGIFGQKQSVSVTFTQKALKPNAYVLKAQTVLYQ